MGGLVLLHLIHDLPRPPVLGGQAIQMRGEVLFHLPLRLDQEAQADLVSQQPGQAAEREGTAVPERVQQAGAVLEFIQTVARPG